MEKITKILYERSYPLIHDIIVICYFHSFSKSSNIYLIVLDNIMAETPRVWLMIPLFGLPQHLVKIHGGERCEICLDLWVRRGALSGLHPRGDGRKWAVTVLAIDGL